MFFYLSFICFSLLGAQNLIFFSGLNFVKISLDSSYVNNQFLGPSRVVYPGPSFPFFLLFSPVFLSFFLLFIFSFFVFSRIFFDFLMFFIFFFHFSDEKVSSFLFTCISFKYF